MPLPPAPYRRRRYWPEPVPHGLLHAVVWRPAPLSGDGAAGRVVVSGADGAAVRRLADGLAARGVAAVPATGDVDAADTVILLGGTDRPTAAAALEREQWQAVTALREALALLDRTGARRLLVVTRDAHVTGEGAERPDPA
ncbi:hypothetical protein GTW38_04960, partial [Streptomyces sp. SID7804]|nr:hypothetical protein [Streptomyces sp. SID7804]